LLSAFESAAAPLRHRGGRIDVGDTSHNSGAQVVKNHLRHYQQENLTRPIAGNNGADDS
jgi:hypothetical protein